jgi:hypothetical protein
MQTILIVSYYLNHYHWFRIEGIWVYFFSSFSKLMILGFVSHLWSIFYVMFSKLGKVINFNMAFRIFFSIPKSKPN